MKDPNLVKLVRRINWYPPYLGMGYIVWDKSAAIAFLKPAKGTIAATFEIDERQLESIRREVDEIGKNTYHFSADLVDRDGTVVARVDKELYVRAKAARQG